MAFTVEELKKKRIGVLMGGLSVEREVSLRTGAACGDALESLGYMVRRIDVQKDVGERLAAEGVEVAFVALHGRWGEDGCVQGLLESLFVPYTGSGVLASALGMDKAVAREMFEARGIRVPPGRVFPDERALEIHGYDLPFGFPVVVKPTCEGSSVGVQIVRTPVELPAAAAVAAKLKGQILVEKYVKGREVQAAVLDGEALGAIEVVPAREFYDYEAKYQAGTTRYLYPAPLPEHLYRKVCDTALSAHRALGCSGATRADLIVDGEGEAWLLEINTLPGMTSASLLPKIAQGRGISFPALCERLLLGASLKA